MRKRVFTLMEVKDIVSKRSGECVNLKIHLGRNKFTDFRGVVASIYPAVFTVISADNETKAFSYFDVACGDVSIV